MARTDVINECAHIILKFSQKDWQTIKKEVFQNLKVDGTEDEDLEESWQEIATPWIELKKNELSFSKDDPLLLTLELALSHLMENSTFIKSKLNFIIEKEKKISTS